MRKVLLVDDEFLVCSFLKNLIVWEDYQFTVVGQANSGYQALERIQELHPDLVFLDVSMPEMDGIELIHLLHRQYPEIQVIMLSSYSDYDYVRETLKLGAVDYLLKHQITAQGLIKLLGELKFAEKDGQQLPPESMDSGYVFHVLRDSRTRSFFEQRTQTAPPALARMQNITAVAALIKISLVAACDVREMEQKESFLTGLLATCAQICAQEYEAKVVYLGEHLLAFLFPARAGETESKQQQRIERCMNIMHDAVLKYHNTCIEWQTAKRCERIEKVPDAYQKALQNLSGKKQSSGREKSCQLTIEQERQLILNVLGKDRMGIHRVLTGIFEPLLHKQVHQTELSLLYGDILTLAVKLYKENHQTFSTDQNYGELSSSPEKVRLYLEELFLSLVRSIDETESYSKAITAAIRYVEEHFREDISLYEVAEHCSMNASYISTLFKKETGISLVQFINRVRIYDAGKRILMEGISPTQVYELSGFHNYNNFFNLFKAITGMNPTSFKTQATVDWIAKFSPLSLR